MKRKFHGYCNNQGKHIIVEVDTENIDNIAKETPFVAYSLGIVEAKDYNEAEKKFKALLSDRLGKIII